MRLRRIVAAGVMAAVAAGALPGLVAAGPAGAVAPSLIQGSGSSWAFPALTVWISAIKSAGVQVVYNPDGDAAGRQDFANKVSDFAVTSDGYLGFTKINGTSDTSQGRQYAYLPIAAGGTAFAYHIVIDGTQVRNLRLSGQTLAKIFTGQITNWNSPTIKRDNNGVGLPSLPIVPVVQSEGSGATEQLTNYFARQFPSIWQPYAGQAGPTEYYPVHGGGIQPVNGSSGAINYVTSSAGNGAITYVEYSYALGANYPVVKVLNSAGYYTLPTQYNVAVSLEAAVINMNPTTPRYLLQTLDGVYTDADPRTYPLSSYVYMIEPTGTYPSPEGKVTTGKRQALADFQYFSICQGQRAIGGIGYSPLPVNLVEAGFGQISKLKAAAPGISLTKQTIYNCNNPTFIPGQPDENYLAQIAPMPPACDQTGAGPCGATVTPNGLGSTPNKSGGFGAPTPTSPTGGGGGSVASSGSSSSPSSGPTATTTPASGTGTSASGTAAVAAAAAAAAANGPKGTAGRGANGTGTTTTTEPPYTSASLAGIDGGSLLARVGPLVAVLLLVVFAVPVVIGYRRLRRRPGGDR
ncbi:MAG TPA: substrate-binding domain-containing protein [Acidimicrobiales bacterium]|nr:substrate-binding domain-containing protein [Acidimicrobiales bacterium]